MSIKEKYTIRSIDTFQCKEWFLKKHYAKRIPMSIYTFGLFSDKLQGIISFGLSANNNLNKIKDFDCIELNRLCINEGLEKNLLSYFVSQSIKQIPKPIIIVSYSDCSKNHHGYIYQATNFIYTGLSEKTGGFNYIIKGKDFHSRSLGNILGSRSHKVVMDAYPDAIPYITSDKYRYFYFHGTKNQIKKMKLKFPYKSYPYPKGDNQRYDASYEPNVQGSLF